MKHYSDRHEFCDENPRCCCSEDDNCGCTFPENMMNDKEDITHTEESFVIKTGDRHIKKDTVCYCSPKNCDCKIDYQETD